MRLRIRNRPAWELSAGSEDLVWMAQVMNGSAAGGVILRRIRKARSHGKSLLQRQSRRRGFDPIEDSFQWQAENDQ
jgi:hypothetical protein